MKTLDLNAYGVQEMSHEEMIETDGGIAPVVAFIAGAIVGGVIYDVVKTAYVASVKAFVKASGEGVYTGMPKYKR